MDKPRLISKGKILIPKVNCAFLLVTVADYADADPAVVKSGRVKKAVANALEKEGEAPFWFILTLCSA